MAGITGWVLRGVGAVLMAGLLAPLTLALPDEWQGAWLLAGLVAVCLALALLIPTRRSHQK
jgi:hypothetical protein